MLEIEIPGCKKLRAAFLVTDYNGTLACDGRLIEGVAPLLCAVAAILEVHVVTADTFGIAAENLRSLPVKLSLLPAGGQDKRKARYVQQLGAGKTIGMGNGRNDRLMLKAAVLGICVIQGEGSSVQTLQAADVVCGSAVDALNLLLNPQRLVATLRR